MRKLRLFRSKTFIATLCGAVVLMLFLVRPGANRLRSRIVNSISLALDRPVEVSSVSLRFLPRPGFDLENFVLYDDPAYSAEPMLRASEVTATLRVSSLLRGRLDIARLNLTEPSLNLVRNRDGHWNLESLLQRAADTPVAPTAKSTSERRPGFPYIEADNGRINFKIRQEKKAYTLTEAEFALWQDSEDTWGARLQAHPVRTDFNLTDTGTLAVNGTWRRAPSLRETPLQFNLQWEGGQLGQISKLIYGGDKGWRGGVEIAATLSGTPASLLVKTSGSVQDFRRYDILGGGALRLAARCSGRYSSIDRSVSDISCEAPVGEGQLLASGSIAGLRTTPAYDLTFTARGVPLDAIRALARHSKKNLPEDIAASGTLDAALTYEGKSGDALWKGKGESKNFHLHSQLTHTELSVERIPFAVSQKPASGRGGGHIAAAQETVVEAGPFHLALGKPGEVSVQGLLSHSGYSFAVRGDARVERLLQAARTVGLAAPQPAADGEARLDLRIAGVWAGFPAPTAVGSVQLRSVEAQVKGLNAPLQIAGANLLLSPDKVSVQRLDASLAGTSWRGSLTVPRHCVSVAACPLQFDLRADTITTEKLGQLVHPNPFSRPWYRFFAPAATPGVPYLAAAHASGKLSVAHLSDSSDGGQPCLGQRRIGQGRTSTLQCRRRIPRRKTYGRMDGEFPGKASGIPCQRRAGSGSAQPAGSGLE